MNSYSRVRSLAVILTSVAVGLAAWPSVFGPAPAGRVAEGQGQRILPIVAQPDYIPAGGYAVMKVHSDGVPVGFSPCRTWPILINLADAPPFAYSVAKDDVAELRQATGVQFVLTGVTDERVSQNREPYQPDRYGADWAPILIDFAPDREERVAGRGGPEAVTAGDVTYYVSGTITLDAKEPWTPFYLREALLHELGHVAGLDHVDLPDQLMYGDSASRWRAQYQAGDRAGLAALGATRCTSIDPVTVAADRSR